MSSEQDLQAWQKQHLPHFHDRETQFVIDWLVRESGRPKRLTELYDTLRFKNDTLRGVISMLSLHGLVEIGRDSRDSRRFVAKPTIKLRRRMKQYARMLSEIASQ